MRALRSTPCRSSAVRAAQGQEVWPSYTSVAAIQIWGSGNSCPQICPENTASLALHERVSFQVVGVYRRHGKIDGVWRDCVIVEKLVGDAAEATLERNTSSSTGSFA
jgi:L-amino acid N-acyltransferase YncA